MEKFLLISILVAVIGSVTQTGEAIGVPDDGWKRAAGVNDIREAACAGTEADIIFAVDSSSSVTEFNFRLELGFLVDLVKKADISSGTVKFGVLTFSSKTYIHFHLNEYKTRDDIIDAISQIPYTYGSTNTADAITTMRKEMFTRQNGHRPGVKKIGVVLTDGVSNINSRRTIPETDEARRAGITMYAMGISIADTRELDGIANRQLDKYRFNVKDFDALQDIEKQLCKSLCFDECFE